jgi:hypothetical protein
MSSSERTEWRQLRDVVGSILDQIERAPAMTGKSIKHGKAASSR